MERGLVAKHQTANREGKGRAMLKEEAVRLAMEYMKKAAVVTMGLMKMMRMRFTLVSRYRQNCSYGMNGMKWWSMM